MRARDACDDLVQAGRRRSYVILPAVMALGSRPSSGARRARRSRLENPLGSVQTHQDAEQRLYARVTEAQRSGALLVDHDGRANLVKGLLADVAVRTGLSNVQKTSVGRKADLPQRGKITQASCRHRSRGCR